MPRTVVDPWFGRRLRRLREARGLSYRQLARLVPCHHVHVWELEHGRKAPSPGLAGRLDQVLSARGELAALMTADPDIGWQPRAERFGRVEAEALADALVAASPTGDNALRLAHEWMVADPPQLYEVRAGRRVGAATARRVEQRVHQLRLLDDHLGGSDSHAVVRAELEATANLLRDGSYSERTGRRLLAACGELAQLAGWVASDAGRTAEAEQLYLTGARAAHAAGDMAGSANNLSCLAYQIANVGDPRDAVLLARTAAVRAERVATVTGRALLLERVAWAHARAGEALACDRALGRVEEAYEQRRVEDDPAWVYWLDVAEIEVMAGRCWTELRRPLRAVPILRRAVAGYGDDQARESALYLSWLAEALLLAGEVDEAATTALRALRLASRAHSARAAARVDVLHEQLREVRSAAVVEFEAAYHAEQEGVGQHSDAVG